MSDADWKAFDSKMEAALVATMHGEAEAFKALCSHTSDVSLFGAFGGLALGWSEVGPRADWAISQFSDGTFKRERLVEHVWDDHAYTVDYERCTFKAPKGGDEVPLNLRVTHVYRREDGDWRVVHRHADTALDTRPPGR